MAAIVASGVVFASLLAGGTFAYLGFQAYKKRRRIPVVDEERAPNLEHTARHLQQDTVLQDVDRPEGQYPSGQWYGSPGIVPADVAPVAKPLPSSPVVEYTGGEGLVSPPERVFRSEEAAKGKGKGRVLEDDPSQQQAMNAYRAHDLQGFGSGYTGFNPQQQLEIVSPKPVRAITPQANAIPKDTAYDEEQEKVSGYWDDIENRKNITTGRKPKHKLQKQSTVLAQYSVHDPPKIDAADMEDVDLNSGPAWAKDKRPATPTPRKTLKIRESFGSSTTLGVANNLNSERPLEHILSKQNMEPEIAKPKAAVVDRAAEVKRRMEEAKRRKAEKERLEEEERQAEERREAEEQREREAEQQRAADQENQRIEGERARTLAQMTGTDEPKRRVWKDSSAQQPVEVKNYGKYAIDSSSDSGSEKARRQSVRRNSNTSTDTKSGRKSREKLFTRSPQRSNTFTGAGTVDNPDANERPSLSVGTNSRSMSMTEPTKPNFNAKMPSIAETSYATKDNDMRTIHESVNSDRSTLVTQPSPVCTSGRDSKASSNQQQGSSAGSSVLHSSSSSGSRQSSVQAPRHSNASSNDSALNNASLPYRGSVDSKASKKSKRSSEGSSDPERKPSMRERAFSKLGRKGSDKAEKLDKSGRARVQNERNSAGSAQSWEHDGP
jgi:hypothetical protein